MESGHAIVDKQSDSGQDWLRDHQSCIGNYGALYAAIFVINSSKETIRRIAQRKSRNHLSVI